MTVLRPSAGLLAEVPLPPFQDLAGSCRSEVEIVEEPLSFRLPTGESCTPRIRADCQEWCKDCYRDAESWLSQFVPRSFFDERMLHIAHPFGTDRTPNQRADRSAGTIAAAFVLGVAKLRLHYEIRALFSSVTEGNRTKTTVYDLKRYLRTHMGPHCTYKQLVAAVAGFREILDGATDAERQDRKRANEEDERRQGRAKQEDTEKLRAAAQRTLAFLAVQLADLEAEVTAIVQSGHDEHLIEEELARLNKKKAELIDQINNLRSATQ